MDHSYIDQFNLIDRYLKGRLAAEESARFEEHFVDCPQCVDRLKTTKNFIQDLRHLSVEQALQSGSYRPERLSSHFWHMPSRKYLGVAAGFLLMVGVAGAIFALDYVQKLRSDADRAKEDSAQWQRSYEELRQAATLSEEKNNKTEQELTGKLRDLEAKLQTEQERRSDMIVGSGMWVQPGVNVPVFALNSVRRGEGNTSVTVNEITLPRSPTGFLISVGLEGEAKYKDYRITILDARNRVILRRGGFRPDRYNNLSIGLNSKSFQHGNYLIRVDGVTNNGGPSPIGNYPFRIIKT
jgi:Putative zinc-finger